MTNLVFFTGRYNWVVLSYNFSISWAEVDLIHGVYGPPVPEAVLFVRDGKKSLHNADFFQCGWGEIG